MKAIKDIWLKWGWIVAPIMIVILAYLALCPRETVRTVEKTVTDKVWQASMTQKLNTLQTNFATQLSEMTKQLSTFKQLAEDIKTTKTEVEEYDIPSGKLAKRTTTTLTEAKKQSSSTTTATTSATSSATSASTLTSAGSTVSTDSGHSHEVENKTTTLNPAPFLIIYGGVGWDSFNGFSPESINLTLALDLFGVKAFIMEDYNFTGQMAMKDRFKTITAIRLTEFK